MVEEAARPVTGILKPAYPFICLLGAKYLLEVLSNQFTFCRYSKTRRLFTGLLRPKTVYWSCKAIRHLRGLLERK